MAISKYGAIGKYGTINIIGPRNREILWGSNPKYVFKKCSVLFLRFMYGHEYILNFPNHFLNIKKLCISFPAGFDLDTFDEIFEQLPHLNYFGIQYSVHQLNLSAWDTINTYPNIETLELNIDNHLKSNLNIYPLCRFLIRQPNIKALRIEITMLKFLYRRFMSENINFIDLYVRWDGQFNFTLTMPIDHILTGFYKKKII